MEVFLPKVINNKKLRKAACSSRASVQYVNSKTLQFLKDILLVLLDKDIEKK